MLCTNKSVIIRNTPALRFISLMSGALNTENPCRLHMLVKLTSAFAGMFSGHACDRELIFFFYAGVVGETGSWCQTGLWFFWNLVCSFINRWHQQVSWIFVLLETSQTSTGQRTEHWLMSSSVKPLVTWSLFKWQKTLEFVCHLWWEP